MIIRKLTVPFIREQLLREAVSYKIAAATISEPGLRFLWQRLPATATGQVVTGLDLQISPTVLRTLLNADADRMTARIFTQNFFHPKVYIFALRNGGQVAFISSGNCTMGGFQENEELSFKIIDAGHISELNSWFDEVFEGAKSLTEDIITQYESVYPVFEERTADTRREQKQLMDSINSSFNWDNIDFTHQYFQHEDYLSLEESKSPLSTPEAYAERIQVQNKLLDLHDRLLTAFPPNWQLNAHYDSSHITSSLDPMNQPEHRVRSVWLAYGRSFSELRRYSNTAKHMEFIRLQVIVRQQEFGIWLMPGKKNGGSEDREYFRERMRDLQYRTRFFGLLQGLGEPYWIEVTGVLRPVGSIENAEQLWEFTQNDDWVNHYFTIGRDYAPGDTGLRTETIVSTIITEFSKLYPLYLQMKDKSFEGV
jgi:HKD family nuclease